MGNLTSFGVSESMVIGGVLLVNGGRPLEGFICLGLGVIGGFVRFTTWFGMNSEKNRLE